MSKLLNSRTKQLEDFTPAKGGVVSLYTCGPTLYDRAHIGNLRTYVAWDVLRRTLEGENTKVKQVMNLTDIDDKIIEKLDGRELDEFTQPYFEAFAADLDSLGVRRPEFVWATRSIPAMGELIARIWENGFAYEREGSIYFSLAKYAEKYDYGVFQSIDPQKLKETGRVDADEYDKDSPQDFALWKAKKEGEPSWSITVDGREFEGRPGWHIECSAMAGSALGVPFDIHTGGVDHLFPHHENEVAQTRAGRGELLARVWLHTEFLAVDGQKMSKSLDNLITLDEVVEKGYDPLDLRYLFLQAHYRSKQNFTWEALRGAATARAKLRELALGQSGGDEAEADRFREILSEDLATPAALAYLWERLGEGSDHRLLVEAAEGVFGLGLLEKLEVETPKEVQQLVEQREAARGEKNFSESDRLRDAIADAGFAVEDTAEGPKLSRRPR